MKVLLTNPPTIDKKRFIREGRCTQEMGVWATLWPPISLAMIGAVLEEAGHQVKLLDCAALNLDIAGFLRALAEFQPGAVFWSCGTPSIDSDLGLADLVKKQWPQAYTGAFGTHVTVLADECLEAAPSLDFIIRGEPEYTIRDLVAGIEVTGIEGEGRGALALSSIPGLSFRESSGAVVSAAAVVHNQDRSFIAPLDELPHPAWHLLDISRYRLPLSGRPFLIIAPSRGCYYGCTFCTSHTYYGRKIRFYSIERVIEEIEANIEKYQVLDFFFWADTFTADPDYVRALCQGIINRNLNIRWTCNSRVDTVDALLFKLMKKAGCWMISFGLESGDQGVLNKSGKGITIEQGTSAVQWAKDAGIKVVGHFVLGLPYDSPHGIRQTIDFATRLELDLAQFYTAVPFPGSKLYTQAKENGWLMEDDFKNFRQNKAIMNLPGLSARQVNKLRKLAYFRYYLRLARGWWSMKILDRRNITHFCTNVRQYLSWMVRG